MNPALIANAVHIIWHDEVDDALFYAAVDFADADNLVTSQRIAINVKGPVAGVFTGSKLHFSGGAEGTNMSEAYIGASMSTFTDPSNQNLSNDAAVILTTILPESCLAAAGATSVNKIDSIGLV